MTTRIAVTRKLAVTALLTIQHSDFERWYSQGVWWAMYGDFQGKGLYDDHYVINTTLNGIQNGWYNEITSGWFGMLGFKLGMVHGGTIDPTRRALRKVTSIVTLTDDSFTDGYRRGLAIDWPEKDSEFMALINHLAITRASEQEVAYELGLYIGNLSNGLCAPLLYEPASEAVTRAIG